MSLGDSRAIENLKIVPVLKTHGPQGHRFLFYLENVKTSELGSFSYQKTVAIRIFPTWPRGPLRPFKLFASVQQRTLKTLNFFHRHTTATAAAKSVSVKTSPLPFLSHPSLIQPCGTHSYLFSNIVRSAKRALTRKKSTLRPSNQ